MKVRAFYLALAALALGAFMVLAMPPWTIWPCAVVSFSLFYVLLDRVRTRRGAVLYGWLFGFGYFVAGLWWIANALLVPGNPFKWVWPLTIAGLPALLAWFPAFACLLCIGRARRRLTGYLTFVAAFGLSEWLRGHVFSGFPWNTYGYGWSGWLAMAQVAAIGGTYFLTLLTVAWATLPGFLFLWDARRRAKIGAALVAIALFLACAQYGVIRLGTAGTFSSVLDTSPLNPDVAVRVVQANVTQADKWNPTKQGDNLKRLFTLSAPAANDPVTPTTVLVWPETALDQEEMRDPAVREAIKATLAQYKNTVYLMTGLMRWVRGPDGAVKNYNGFVVYDRALHPLTVYDKSHLVPFGEYIPLQKYLLLHSFVSMEGFTPGSGPVTTKITGLPPFTALICYEIIFPGAVTGRGAPPHWLVNVTNDAWYGDSPGPRQHFAQTQFRAIEEGVPVVRAAETGISGVIDPLGRVVERVELGRAGAPITNLPLPLARPPLYTRWRDGLFFASLLLLAVAAFLLRVGPRATPKV